MKFPFQVDVFTNFKQAHIYIAFAEKEKFQGIQCDALLYFFSRCFWKEIIRGK